MAARQNTSVVVMVAMGLVSAIAVVLFITTIIFVSRFQEAQRNLEAAERQRAEAVTPQESDLFSRLRQASGNQSVVGYLNDRYQSLADLAVGNRNRGPEEIQTTFDDLLGDGEYDTLQGAVSRLTNQVDQLQNEVERARADAERARVDLTQAEQSLQAVRNQYEQDFARQASRVGQAFDNAEAYRADFDDARNDFESRLRSERADSAAVVSELESRQNELLDEIARLQQVIASRGDDQNLPMPQDEDALRDGAIVGTNLARNEVFLSLGRQDRVPIGITFEVYSANASIQPNAIGEFPPGKATVEVIRVDERTTVARVLREVRGNRIVPGDVIVNAVYDPEKEYEFVVFGDFDANQDFIATPQEANRIRAIIREWGGEVSTELSGTTDYVVLGERPVLPPEPRFDDPQPVLDRYAEARQRQIRYDNLLEQATALRIPVLNTNRLFTLTGMDERL